MGNIDMQMTKQLERDHTRIPIWGSAIPGNSPKQKSTVMDAKEKKMGKFSSILLTIRWLKSLQNHPFRDPKKIVDSYVMNIVAEEDKDYHDTFTDVPYLIPYIARGSRKAVIVVPGGGYCMKSMESEGVQIAEKLQENGITAFVLWYRSCPYYMPIPILDLQRAVRVVRNMASACGFDSDQISAVGFSAGGAQIALFANIFQGKNIFPEKYAEDAIDRIDDRLNYQALVYPALNFESNQSMLFASFPGEMARDEKIRAQLMEQYDALRHFRCEQVPQYFCYGTKDNMVSLDAFAEYRKRSRYPGNQLTVVEGAGHGFGASKGGKYGYWMKDYIAWLNQR